MYFFLARAKARVKKVHLRTRRIYARGVPFGTNWHRNYTLRCMNYFFEHQKNNSEILYTIFFSYEFLIRNYAKKKYFAFFYFSNHMLFCHPFFLFSYKKTYNENRTIITAIAYKVIKISKKIFYFSNCTVL